MERRLLSNLSLSLLVQIFLFIRLTASKQCDNLTTSRHGQSPPETPSNVRPKTPPPATFSSSYFFDSKHFDLIFNLSARFVDFVAEEDRILINFYQPAIDDDDYNNNRSSVTLVGGLLRDFGAAVSWLYLEDNSDRLWTHFLTHKLATTSLICFLLIIVLCFPVFGFFFCVCRCCCGGRCGGKSHPMDKKWDNCRRFFYTLFTLAFVMGMLLAVVAGFAMATIFIRGLESSGDGVENEINQLRTTRYNMVSRIDSGVVQEFGRATDRIATTVANAGNFVEEEVNKLCGIRSFLEKGINLTGHSLAIHERIAQLNNLTYQLRESDLHVVVESLRSIYESDECVDGDRDKICQRINETLSTYALLRRVADSFPPQLTDVADEIIRIVFLDKDEGLISHLNESIHEYRGIRDRVIQAVKRTEFEMTEALTEGKQHVGKEICMFTGRMKNHFDVVRMRKKAKIYLEMFEDFKSEKDGIELIKAALLGLASVNTLMALLLGLGLLHVCGSRPGRGRSCSRGCGACFLMTAVSLFLLLGWILIIILIVLLVVGSQLKTEICHPVADPFQHPNSSLELLMKEMNYFSPEVNELSFSNVLSKCQYNKTVYSILKQTHLFDDDYYQFESQITIDKAYPFLEEILEEFSESAIEHVRALTPDFFTKHIQESFSQLGDLNLTQFLPILADYYPTPSANESNADEAVFDDAKRLVDDVIERVDLIHLKDTLVKASSKSIDAGKTSLARQYHTLKLRVEQMEAENYVEELFRPLLTNLSIVVAELNRAVDFENEVAVMAFNATSSSNNLHTTWKQVVQDATLKYVSDLRAVIGAELAALLRALESHIGPCDPVWRLFSNLTTVACDNVLVPFNGFWFCLSGFLLFTFFAVFFAIKLVTLYRKKNRYDADFRADPSFDNPRGVDARHRRQNRSKDPFYGYSPGQAEHMPLTLDHSGNYQRPAAHHHNHHHRFSRGSSVASGGAMGGRGGEGGAPPMGRGVSDYYISEYPPHLRPNHPSQRLVSSSPSPDDLPPPPYPDYPPPPDVDHYPPHDAEAAGRRRPARGGGGGGGGSGGARSGAANPSAPPPYCLPGGGLDDTAAPPAVMGESVDEGWMMDDEWTVDSPKSPMRMP